MNGVSLEELQLAARNHGMPMEALRRDLTPAGMHYVLVHYDVPDLELADFRLRVTGHVERELDLALDDLRLGPTITEPVTLECAGNGRALLDPRPISQPWLRDAVGTAEWTGTPLAPLLEQCGIRDGAVDVVFGGADRGVEGGVDQTYRRALPVGDALHPDLLLAWGMNGAPLPPQHGFPLRLVVPGWYGMASVKWLTQITVLDHRFDGYQNAVAYRMRRDADDPGVPVTRMLPRSLLAPPGVPDFMTRRRHLPPGPVTLEGRAWSGCGEIVRVEVSTDAGRRWADAGLDPALGPYAWRRFELGWDAAPGDHLVLTRATDSAGHVQPLEPEWNAGGYANNAVQATPVTVRAAA